MKSLGWLILCGAGLIAVAAWIGGWAAGIGGGIALIAQTWAVALLGPAMQAPSPQFMARWLGGMAVRVLALGALLTWAATHPHSLPVLPASLGFLGVLLPLLFLETRFLK